MAQWGGDAAATHVQDSCVVRHGSGRHSLRMTTPREGRGLRAWSYPVKTTLLVGSEYTLSFWARGGEVNQTLHVGFEALFGEVAVRCPGGAISQCSYTPQAVTLEFNTWRQFVLRSTCRFQPDQTGYLGAAGMVSIELVSAGSAWVDDIVLALSSHEDEGATPTM